jgi:hypothetical protein
VVSDSGTPAAVTRRSSRNGRMRSVGLWMRSKQGDMPLSFLSLTALDRHEPVHTYYTF